VQFLCTMKRNYTFEIDLPVKTSDTISDIELNEIKEYLNRYICETFEICNANIKIVTKITNN